MTCARCGCAIRRRFRRGAAPKYCRPCKREIHNSYNRAYNRRYKHPDAMERRRQHREGHRRTRQREREACIRAYGGKCACCGEARPEFLALDHIHGGGVRHRRQIKSSLDHWLYRQGFPEGYRVLCHNCNCALGFYGYCPHGALQQQRPSTPQQEKAFT